MTAMDRPRTIHDFGGFPHELNAKQYPAPGSPELVRRMAELVRSAPVGPDQRGASTTAAGRCWPHVPPADIPVMQLSLDRRGIPKRLRAGARDRGTARARCAGAGQRQHGAQPGRADRRPANASFDWAIEFDARVERLIDARITSPDPYDQPGAPRSPPS